MGLLSFLSRKSLADKRGQDTNLITQPYHGAAASVPPVRGTYPLGGNGPRNSQRLRPAYDIGRPQGPLNISPLVEDTAPSPAVPLFRDEGIERPRTPPNVGLLPPNWGPGSKNWSSKSHTKSRLSVSSMNPTQESGTTGSASVRSILKGASESKTEPSKAASRPHTDQLRGNLIPAASVRGFKDILDAQSELKPLDFKSRIKASGARDYGEDVADRNIGENGHNLELPEVQAFYAHTTSNDTLRKPKWVSMSNISKPYRGDEIIYSQIPKPASLESGLRSTPLTSSRTYIRQNQRASHVPPLSTSTTPVPRQKLDERPTTSDAIPRPRSSNAFAQGSIEAGSLDVKTKQRLSHRGRPPLPLPPLRIASTSLDSGVGGLGPSSPELQLGPPLAKHGAVAEPSSVQRLAMPTSEETEQAETGLGLGDQHTTRPLSSQRSFSPKPSAKRRSGTISSVASSNKTYAMHSVKPSIASSFASYHTAIDTTALAYPPNRQRGNSSKDAKRATLPCNVMKVDGTEAHHAVSSSPYMKTGAALYEFGNVHTHHQKTKSLTLSPREVNTEELCDVVPMRTSSLRNWSMSSTTPTTSDTSSNPFPRPQSPHTATTSVDLGNMFSLKNASHASLLSVGGVSVIGPPMTPKSGGFNIDDYVSSDDDSLEPKRLRGEGEEELLFSTSGYGMGGFQLPGLAESLASSPPKQSLITDDVMSYRPRSSASLPSGYLHNAFGNPGSLSPRRRHYILDTAADYDDDEDEDDTQSWHEGGTYAVGSDMLSSAKCIRGTRRLTALGSLYGHARPTQEEVIEEERDMSKIDIAAAVKMRKEAKARKRASAAVSKRRLKGKGKERATRMEADEAHHADMEC